MESECYETLLEIIGNIDSTREPSTLARKSMISSQIALSKHTKVAKLVEIISAFGEVFAEQSETIS